MVAFEGYAHGHAYRCVSTMVELESYYTGKAARVVLVVDPMSVSAIEEGPHSPDNTKLVFKDASERIVWGERDDVIAKLSEHIHVRPTPSLSELGMPRDPSWTNKERLFAAYGVVASALAAYGAAHLTTLILEPVHSDVLAPMLMVAVFVATLLLTLTSVDHVKRQRIEAWVKERDEREDRHWQRMTPRPGGLPERSGS